MSAYIRWLLALSLVSGTSLVKATPITYQFEMPNWTVDTAASQFGTNAILDITVDNGSSSNLNQTYLNSQITNISFKTIGGTAHDSFAIGTPGVVTNPPGDASYISTDGTGIATLNLLSVTNPQLVSDYLTTDSTFELQLGVLNAVTGGPTSFYVGMSDGTSDALVSPYNSHEFLGLEVSGTVVPLPASVWLMLSSLGGLFLCRRGKSTNAGSC